MACGCGSTGIVVVIFGSLMGLDAGTRMTTLRGSQDADGDVTCTCSTPNTGTSGHNQYTCSDGTSAYCAADQECYATGAFAKGNWGMGCQITCQCATPHAGTAGHNQYSCTDGKTAYCAADQQCWASTPFLFGDWTTGCNQPAGSGVCKDWCSNRNHENEPWIGGKCSWKNCGGCAECTSLVANPASKSHPTKLAVRADDDVTCTCSTPNTGTSGHNQYTCSDGTSAYCAADQECYATGAFAKGNWGMGCQITCQCTTPQAGTAGHNQYSCTDGKTAYCAADQQCWASTPFLYGDWTIGCNQPEGSGVCKDWCSNRNHANEPWIGGKCSWKSCGGCAECTSLVQKQ